MQHAGCLRCRLATSRWDKSRRRKRGTRFLRRGIGVTLGRSAEGGSQEGARFRVVPIFSASWCRAVRRAVVSATPDQTFVTNGTSTRLSPLRAEVHRGDFTRSVADRSGAGINAGRARQRSPRGVRGLQYVGAVTPRRSGGFSSEGNSHDRRPLGRTSPHLSDGTIDRAFAPNPNGCVCPTRSGSLSTCRRLQSDGGRGVHNRASEPRRPHDELARGNRGGWTP